MRNFLFAFFLFASTFTGLAQRPTGFNPNTYEPTYGASSSEDDSLKIVSAFYIGIAFINQIENNPGNTTYYLEGDAWIINSKIGNLFTKKDRNTRINFTSYTVSDSATRLNVMLYGYDNEQGHTGQVWFGNPDNWKSDDKTWFFQLLDGEVTFSELNTGKFEALTPDENQLMSKFLENLDTEWTVTNDKQNSVDVEVLKMLQQQIDADDAKNKLHDFGVIVASDTILATMYGGKVEHPLVGTNKATVVFWPEKPGVQVSSLPTQSLSARAWQLQIRLNNGTMFFMNYAWEVTVMDADGNKQKTEDRELRKILIEAASMIPF